MRTKVPSPGFVLAVALLCASLRWRGQGRASATKNPADAETAVLVGAGDIADCSDLAGAEGTAALLGRIPGMIFAAGDLAYPDGSAEQFAKCYGPTWGRYKDRTRPSPGNHEFHSGGATPYFDYFGSAAGDPGKGYYSYDLGSWHVISLNSNCPELRYAAARPGRLRSSGYVRTSPSTPPLAPWPIFITLSSARAGGTGMTLP